MRAILLVALLSACTSDDSVLRFERQSSTLAAADDTAWAAGSAVVVAETGTFTFPQPLSIRLSLVDDPDAEMPAPQLVSSATLAVYGASAAEVVHDISCQPMYCEAELQLTDAGVAVLQVEAVGKDATTSDCFFFAVHEAADPGAERDTLRADAESQQRECVRSLFD